MGKERELSSTVANKEKLKVDLLSTLPEVRGWTVGRPGRRDYIDRPVEG